MEKQKFIRNFAIIAHIDHGKSTLCDRLIQICKGLEEREMKEQVLDSMDLERERGITIKAQSVSLNYTAKDGNTYRLNLIDTPGHVDFSYEVSRSLAACEGAVLIVDASQGVEAQTLANCYQALNLDLEIVVVLNKIDLPAAEPNRVIQEIEDMLGLPCNDAVKCSAKTGEGVEDVLQSIVDKIPGPTFDSNAPLQALIIDSWFDNYLGVVALLRLKNGSIKKGQKIKVMSTKKTFEVDKVGIFTPKRSEIQALNCGDIGWITCGIKDISALPVGDTITHPNCDIALPGFQKSKPQVFAGLFPMNADDFEAFRDALGKLSLNDAALFYEPENSGALGCGFRCGFLGLLHMEIIQQRLSREYNLDIIATAPTVNYKIITKDKCTLDIDNPVKMPAVAKIDHIEEPIALCTILCPKEHIGNVIKLCIEKRGKQRNMMYHGNQVELTYEIPMAEVVMDFFDRLKSVSKGYASLDYQFYKFEPSDMVRLDILVNHERVDALSWITHRDKAYHYGSKMVEKLKNLIPRQQFDIAIQAAIGNHIIARSTVKQLRKNVLAKCYGGDVTRKKKLLEKQKEGKKKMKNIGNVELPQQAFLSILSIRGEQD